MVRHWKCNKIQTYKTCHNRKKKKLFGVGAKLYSTKGFTKNLPTIEMKKTQITMNKLYLGINFVYLGLSILDLSKTAMQEFWFDYMKPKYGEKVKLFYMDTNIAHVKVEDIHEYILEDVEQRYFKL